MSHTTLAVKKEEGKEKVSRLFQIKTKTLPNDKEIKLTLVKLVISLV